MRQFLIYSLFFIGLLQGCNNTTETDSECQSKPKEPIRLLWSFAYQGEPGYSTYISKPQFIDKESVIISPDNYIYKINQEDGSLEWNASTPDSSAVNTKHLLFDNNNLYVKADMGKKIKAYKLSNGQTAWVNSLPDTTSGNFYDLISDAVNTDDLFLTGQYGYLYNFTINGKYKSTYHFPPSLQSLITYKNNLIISQGFKSSQKEGTSDGQVIAVNAMTFNELWRYETKQVGGFFYAAPIIQNGTYYNGTASGLGEFVALNVQTGQVKWKQQGFQCRWLTMANDTLYIEHGSGIVALDARDGQELWTYEYGDSGGNNLAYMNGYIYNAHGGRLNIFNAKTGKKVADPVSAPDGSSFYNINAANGKVFVQSSYHLYCYQAYNGGSDE